MRSISLSHLPPFTPTRDFNRNSLSSTRYAELDNVGGSSQTSRLAVHQHADFPTTSVNEELTTTEQAESQRIGDKDVVNEKYDSLAWWQNALIFSATALSTPDTLITRSETSQDGQWSFSCDKRGFIRVGKTSQGLPTRVIGVVNDEDQIALSPNGQWIVWKDALGLAYKRLSPESEIRRQLGIQWNENITFSPDSQSLVLPQRYDALGELKENAEKIEQELKGVKKLAKDLEDKINLGDSKTILLLGLGAVKFMPLIALGASAAYTATAIWQVWQGLKQKELEKKLPAQQETLRQARSKLRTEHPEKTQIQRLLLESNELSDAVKIDTKHRATSTELPRKDALSGDGKYFFALQDDVISKWSTETGELVASISLKALKILPAWIETLLPSQTGKWLAFTTERVPNETNIYLSPLTEAKSETTTHFGTSIANAVELKFSPNDQWFAALDVRGQITVFSTVSTKFIQLEDARSIHAISWGADNILYAIDANKRQRAWQAYPRQGISLRSVSWRHRAINVTNFS